MDQKRRVRMRIGRAFQNTTVAIHFYARAKSAHQIPEGDIPRKHDYDKRCDPDKKWVA